jgi:hypothetical protein
MPYINKNRRESATWAPETPGELNYAITDAINSYRVGKPLGYQTINDILGAIEGAKLEFYRRIVVPFEEKKRKKNGDVYK